MIDDLIKYGVISMVKSRIRYSYCTEYTLEGVCEELRYKYQARLTDVLSQRNLKKVVRLQLMLMISNIYFKAFEGRLNGEYITYMIEHGVSKCINRHSKMRTVACGYYFDG